MRRPSVRQVAGLLVLFLGACGKDLLAPFPDLEPLGDNPSRLIYGEEVGEIDLPTSAPLGSTLSIEVWTFGNGCAEQGRTDVVARDGGLDVYPYDTYHGHACPDALHLFRHLASFTPSMRGDLVIRFHGIRYSWADDATRRIPVTITRMVRVE